MINPKQDSLPSPSVAPLPLGCTPKLIDKGLLQYEASVAGYAERYGRGETSHTIHVWWARRPHTAMRALIFASLCKRSDEQADRLLSQIGLNTSLPYRIINEAQSFLLKQYNTPPKMLDMFGGGGTIPFEALNLGAEAYAIDSNELSVFIQKCNLVYSQSANKKNIQTILKTSGERVLNQLRRATDPLYPLRGAELELCGRSVFAYLWTYSMECDRCKYRYFVLKRPWLSKKKDKNLAFIVQDREERQTLSFETVKKDYNYATTWIGRNGTTKCPKCAFIEKRIDIKKCSDELVAMIRPTEGRGKEFILPSDDALPSQDVIDKIEADALKSLGIKLPKSELPMWSGIVNPALYGMRTHADFLNPRQRVALVLLIKCLHHEYERLIKNETVDIAKYIISLLSSLIDQVVDWNCRLSMWIPQNEQVGRGFCGPGISMLWDYAETDPVSSGPSNLWDKLQRIIKGSVSIKKFQQNGHISHAYAQKLPFVDDFFDGIITDPPYYDNVYYSVLADFFFSWKRLLLGKIDTELFGTEATDYSHELVASTKRNGTPQKAHEEYCNQLWQAISEASRVLKPDGIFSFIYSHSSLNGWEALIRAYRPSNLIITSVQPLSIERKQRPRAMTSQAVNTCITFVARKSLGNKHQESLENIIGNIKSICDSKYIFDLMEWGWSESDAALAVFAHGVGLLANAKEIKDTNDLEAMVAIEEIIKQKAPSFRVVRRKSL